jgi:hypothetical protein
MKNIQVTIDIGPLAIKGGNKSAQSARWQLKNTSIGMPYGCTLCLLNQIKTKDFVAMQV